MARQPLRFAGIDNARARNRILRYARKARYLRDRAYVQLTGLEVHARIYPCRVAHQPQVHAAQRARQLTPVYALEHVQRFGRVAQQQRALSLVGLSAARSLVQFHTGMRSLAAQRIQRLREFTLTQQPRQPLIERIRTRTLAQRIHARSAGNAISPYLGIQPCAFGLYD